MSPIFLSFVESVWSFKSKRSKRRDQENGEIGLEPSHSIISQEALQNASRINDGCDSIKRGSQ